MMSGYGVGVMAGPGGWLIVLGCVVLVVGLALLAAWVAGRTGANTGAGTTGRQGDDALEVLRLRFARGEMTTDEYVAAKRTLEDGR